MAIFFTSKSRLGGVTTLEGNQLSLRLFGVYAVASLPATKMRGLKGAAIKYTSSR
jgi:hypothetical protein